MAACRCGAQVRTDIAVDQIRTISKQRLGQRIDGLSVDNAAELRCIISEMYTE